MKQVHGGLVSGSQQIPMDWVAAERDLGALTRRLETMNGV